jgi:hypothetical protein
MEQLPAQFSKVAWVDADVVFLNPVWHSKASDLLKSYDLVQLFDHVLQLDASGAVASVHQGLAGHIALGLPDPFDFGKSNTWPGIGWAATRELLESHGLLDTMVVGGADSLIALAAYGCWDHFLVDALSDGLRRHWKAWGSRFHEAVGGRVACVPGGVVQLWHGSALARQYIERLEILRVNDFDPETDLVAGSRNVWQWSSKKPCLHAGVRAYFKSRAEE